METVKTILGLTVKTIKLGKILFFLGLELAFHGPGRNSLEKHSIL